MVTANLWFVSLDFDLKLGHRFVELLRCLKLYQRQWKSPSYFGSLSDNHVALFSLEIVDSLLEEVVFKLELVVSLKRQLFQLKQILYFPLILIAADDPFESQSFGLRAEDKIIGVSDEFEKLLWFLEARNRATLFIKVNCLFQFGLWHLKR